MALAILHPRISNQQAVTVFFLIRKLAVNQCTILLDAATFQQFVTRKDRIDDMQVRVAGANLHRNRLAIAGELVIGHVEPVVRLCGWLLVVQTKHHKRHVQLIVTACSFQTVFATL